MGIRVTENHVTRSKHYPFIDNIAGQNTFIVFYLTESYLFNLDILTSSMNVDFTTESIFQLRTIFILSRL